MKMQKMNKFKVGDIVCFSPYHKGSTIYKIVFLGDGVVNIKNNLGNTYYHHPIKYIEKIPVITGLHFTATKQEYSYVLDFFAACCFLRDFYAYPYLELSNDYFH